MIYNCPQNGCDVAKTGICLEGLELSSCPYIVSEEASFEQSYTSPHEGISSQASKSSEMVMIPYGADLDIISAARITECAPTRFIVLAGDVGSGKTTLLTSIYDKFLDGVFAGYMFAGSETLCGFEQRCHFSRIESESIESNTERTLHMPLTMLHLCVYKYELPRKFQNLLFSDVTGEKFEDARNSTEACKQLEFLRRADHFVLLLDGEKLSSIESRQLILRNGIMLLRSCLDSNILNKNSAVDILLTKYDLVEPVEHINQTSEFIEFLKQSFINSFQTRVKQLSFYKIAARSKNLEAISKYGLDSIFQSWVENSSLYANSNSIAKNIKTAVREFDYYLYRRINNLSNFQYLEWN